MFSRTIFNDFNLGQIRSDILGGFTTAIVSLPLALAFGVSSGAGAEAGLYGAILIGLFAAMFGGTPTLISEPTGPMTVVMTAVIAGMIAANPENGMAMAFTVVMIAGVSQIIFGSLRLGRYITLMPYSVVSGFMSGIGVLLIIFQMPNFLGHGTAGGDVFAILQEIPRQIHRADLSEILLGSIALAILFFTPKRITSILPPQIIALVICTVLSVSLLSSVEVRRIGEISFGLPSVYFPTFTTSELQTMLLSGLMLGALGCIDSLLTAVIAESLTRKEHKSDKELIAQGIANTISGIFGGLPGAGATMGTVVNVQVGARSAYSGVVRAVVLFVVVAGAADLVQFIPMAVLAAIAIKVGLNILDWSFVKRAHRISKAAALVMYCVMLLTVFVDLVVAVGVGMFIANLLTIERLSKVQEKNIQMVSDADDRVPLTTKEKELFAQANQKAFTLLVYLSGPMMFGISRALQRESSAIDNAEVMVLDLTDVPFIDPTIAVAIENMLLEASNKNIPIWVVIPDRKNKYFDDVLNQLKESNIVNVANSRQTAFTGILG